MPEPYHTAIPGFVYGGMVCARGEVLCVQMPEKMLQGAKQ